MKKAVIVARFQVPELNSSICILLENLLSEHENVLIVLAESRIPGSRKNPLSVKARIAMIKSKFPGINILSIKDHPHDDVWSTSLDQLLVQHGGASDYLIYGTKEGFGSRYSGNFPVRELAVQTKEFEAIQEVPGSGDFRKGRVHAFETSYPKVFPTVDVALFRNRRSEILLGRKTIDKTRWRLIGGFVDPSDQSYEEAAKRELCEEAGELVTTDFIYEGSFKIDDWRYRYEQDKIISTLFSTEFISGTPSGSDDLAEVRWYLLTDVKKLLEAGETVSEHEPLFKILLMKYALE